MGGQDFKEMKKHIESKMSSELLSYFHPQGADLLAYCFLYPRLTIRVFYKHLCEVLQLIRRSPHCSDFVSFVGTDRFYSTVPRIDFWINMISHFKVEFQLYFHFSRDLSIEQMLPQLVFEHPVIQTPPNHFAKLITEYKAVEPNWLMERFQYWSLHDLVKYNHSVHMDAKNKGIGPPRCVVCKVTPDWPNLQVEYMISAERWPHHVGLGKLVELTDTPRDSPVFTHHSMTWVNHSAPIQKLFETHSPASSSFPSLTLHPSHLKTQLTNEQKATLTLMRQAEEKPWLVNMGHVVPNSEQDFTLMTPFATPHAKTVTAEQMNKVKEWTGGIVANQTGCGKTLSALAICSPDSTSLIIVPDKLHLHWKTEVEKHVNSPITIIHRAADLKQGTIHFENTVITTMSALRSKFWPIHKKWDRVLVDEAHLVKRGQKIGALLATCDLERTATWLLTATPYDAMRDLRCFLRFDLMLEHLGLYIHHYGQHTKTCYFLIKYYSTHHKIASGGVTFASRVVFANTTPEEATFLHKVKQLFENAHKKTLTEFTNLNRVFRILERISAGHRINPTLMLQVIEYCLSKPDFSRCAEDTLSIQPQAQQPAFANPEDDCVVCLESFTKPVQLLTCNHVFCSTCLLALSKIKTQCPMCRIQFSTPIKVTTPWQTTEQEEKKENQPDGLISQRDFKNLLEGGGSMAMQGKIQAFQQEFQRFCQQYQPGQHLVVFIKRSQPAEQYINIIEQEGQFKYLTAGFATHQQSLENIEAFRKGEAVILVCSDNYSTGFDFNQCSHCFVMDFNCNLSKMKQCQGRVTRLSQKHTQVQLVHFLYENSFDHFLYNFSHLNHGHASKSNLVLLEYFWFRNNPETTMGRIHRSAQLQLLGSPLSLSQVSCYSHSLRFQSSTNDDSVTYYLSSHSI